MAEKLFWEVLAHLNEISPNFRIQGRRYCALPRRFKRMIHVVDSTTIQLIANCLDWAKHRRRKAAAKMHLRLDLRSFLPNFILVKTAGTHDSAEAPALCVGINEGEIVIFDKAYVDFKHLWRLSQRGVFWITRAKDNMKYDVVGQHSAPKLNILRDVVIYINGEEAGSRSIAAYEKENVFEKEKNSNFASYLGGEIRIARVKVKNDLSSRIQIQKETDQWLDSVEE